VEQERLARFGEATDFRVRGPPLQCDVIGIHVVFEAALGGDGGAGKANELALALGRVVPGEHGAGDHRARAGVVRDLPTQ